jgi:AraC-like DNA-binding protein
VLDHVTYPPPPALADLVRCVWTLEGVPAPVPQRVLPDGCVEIVYNLGSPLRRLGEDGGLQAIQPRAQVIGPTTRHVRLLGGGPVSVVGARLRPGAAPAFVASGLGELRDGYAELVSAAPALDRALLDQLAVAGDGATRAALLFAALASSARRERLDPAALAAADEVERRGGLLAVGGAARRLGLSARTLERRFLRAVGVGVKRLSRLVRLQSVLAASAGRPRLATMLAAGYFDQSHFLRDFRELAGTSPSRFFAAERNELAAAFVVIAARDAFFQDAAPVPA